MSADPTSEATRPGRGRVAAASREDVLALALTWFLDRRRLVVRAIAAELGVGRATVYRWYGSREGLLAEVLLASAERIVAHATRTATGKGPRRALAIFTTMNELLGGSEPLRHFVEAERDVALRILTDGTGPFQPRMVELVQGVLDEEVAAGRLDPPVDTPTLAYATVRLFEAFFYADAMAGLKGDLEKLRAVEAALLGVRP